MEGLPVEEHEAEAEMHAWRANHYWRSSAFRKFANFMFGCAVHVQRSVFVLELTEDGAVRDPARVYGAREGGELQRDAQGWLRSWSPVTFDALLTRLRDDSPCSLVVFNRAEEHFHPLLQDPPAETEVVVVLDAVPVFTTTEADDVVILDAVPVVTETADAVSLPVTMGMEDVVILDAVPVTEMGPPKLGKVVVGMRSEYGATLPPDRVDATRSGGGLGNPVMLPPGGHLRDAVVWAHDRRIRRLLAVKGARSYLMARSEIVPRMPGQSMRQAIASPQFRHAFGTQTQEDLSAWLVTNLDTPAAEVWWLRRMFHLVQHVAAGKDLWLLCACHREGDVHGPACHCDGLARHISDLAGAVASTEEASLYATQPMLLRQRKIQWAE